MFALHKRFRHGEHGDFYERGHGHAAFRERGSGARGGAGRFTDQGADGACPLCDNHCPLDDPGCGKGAVLAARRHGSMMEADMAEEWDHGQGEGPMTGGRLLGLFRRAAGGMARAHHSRGHAQHAQARVLALLLEREPMSQRDLMELLHVRSASLSELLVKLERGGFIARERSADDRRNYIITVTEQGREAAARHRAEYGENADALFAALSEEEREQLGRLLGKLALALAEHEQGHERGHGRDARQGRGFGRGHGRAFGRSRHGHDAE